MPLRRVRHLAAYRSQKVLALYNVWPEMLTAIIRFLTRAKRGRNGWTKTTSGSQIPKWLRPVSTIRQRYDLYRLYMVNQSSHHVV